MTTGSQIQTQRGAVLAVVASKGAAQCRHPGCPTSIQRTSTGDLIDGVLAH